MREISCYTQRAHFVGLWMWTISGVSMESKFIPTLQAGNGYTYLKLKGVLDEDNLLANLLSQIQGRLLLIDMAEIERINSCGVRDWVNWLNQIQALGVAVILLKCSPVVVSQANMVANFASDAFIHSFYAPYVHPDTGDEQSVLLFTEDIRQNQPIRAPKIFNESGEELEFDEFEESYFAFINDPRILTYQIPADIQAVIQYFMPEAVARRPVISTPGQESAPAAMQMNAYNAQNAGGAGQGYGANSYGAQQQPYGSAYQAQNPYMQTSPNNSMQGGGMGGYGAQQPQAVPSAMPRQSMNGYGNAQNGYVPQAGFQAQQQNAPMGMGQQGAGNVPDSAVMPQPAQPIRHEQPPLPSENNYQSVAPRQSSPRPSVVMPQKPPQMPGARFNHQPPQAPVHGPAPSAANPPAPSVSAGDKSIPSLVQNMPVRKEAPDPAPVAAAPKPSQPNPIEALHQPTISIQNNKGLLSPKNQKIMLLIALAVVLVLVVIVIAIVVRSLKG